MLGQAQPPWSNCCKCIFVCLCIPSYKTWRISLSKRRSKITIVVILQMFFLTFSWQQKASWSRCLQSVRSHQFSWPPIMTITQFSSRPRNQVTGDEETEKQFDSWVSSHLVTHVIMLSLHLYTAIATLFAKYHTIVYSLRLVRQILIWKDQNYHSAFRLSYNFP